MYQKLQTKMKSLFTFVSEYSQTETIYHER